MLKIKFTDNRQAPFWVMEKSYSIGRNKDNHLTIEHPSISENHARIIREGDSFTLRDLAGSSGTFVNGKKVSNSQVSCGDVIRVGAVSLEIIDPLLEVKERNTDYWSLIADSSWLSGQEFPLVLQQDKPVTLGRGTDCDIVFPSTHLSRQHAQITLTEQGVILEDLKSANGTFINDKKIKEAEIKPGDRIRFDVYSFRFFGPGIELPKSSTTSFNIAIKPEKVIKATTKPFTQLASPKAWKTRPTSPGNREEPTYSKASKISGWVAATAILGIFIAIAIYVLSSN